MSNDPTYVMTDIQGNPTWRIAFVISEVLNDDAPIGWGKYIPVAEAILKEQSNGLYSTRFNCHTAMRPGEPFFTLLGRDPAAAGLVEMWCELRSEFIKLGIKPPDDMAKVVEGRRIADDMRSYRLDQERQQRDRAEISVLRGE